MEVIFNNHTEETKKGSSRAKSYIVDTKSTSEELVDVSRILKRSLIKKNGRNLSLEDQMRISEALRLASEMLRQTLEIARQRADEVLGTSSSS